MGKYPGAAGAPGTRGHVIETKSPPIRGVQELSLTHWPGKVASVIYLGGCTLRCSTCPAPHLMGWDRGHGLIPLDSILDAIYRRRRWIEGVVVKGGEPLAHAEVFELLELLKDFGLDVKVDTNGTRPAMLERLMREELADYVAVELKAPFGNSYQRLARSDVKLGDLFRTVEIVLSGSVEYEFRTAVYDGLMTEEDVVSIARTIRGARRFVLRSVPGRGPGRARLRALARLAGKYVDECLVDGGSPERMLPSRVEPVGRERKGV